MVNKGQKYSLNQGDLWRFDGDLVERSAGEEFFDCLDLKEQRKIYYREAGQLQRILQKKAELCVKQFYPGQKARVDLLIYHLVHEKGKVVARRQIYVDVNVYTPFVDKNSQFADADKKILLPPACRTALADYQSKLQEINQQLTNQDKAPRTFGEGSLKKEEDKLKECASKYLADLKHTLFHSKDETSRAQAAWLLGWAEGREAPRLLFQVLQKDNSHSVHNNAGLALLSLARRQRIEFNLEAIYHLLSHPSTACRNKAGFLLLHAIKQGHLHKLGGQPKAILIQMSQARQPNNREPAELIFQELKKQKAA